MDLTKQSKQWHSEADDLLGKSKLIEILEEFGEVHLSGSYKYDLMLGPDIDLLIVCQNPETAAKNLHSKLIDQRFWNGYLFYDWGNFRSPKHPEYPKAYYVGAKVTHNKHRWKVDIWLVDKYPENIDDSWIINTSAENKSIILKLKEARNNGEIVASSYDIYDAVINKGEKSAKSFAGNIVQDKCEYRISIKGVEFDDNGRVLLAREDNGMWELLGGGLDHNEDPIDCLKREVFEETGIKVTYVSPVPKFFITAPKAFQKGYLANIVYEIKLENHDFKPSAECQELRYFSVNEMKKEKLFPNVEKLIKQLE